MFWCKNNAWRVEFVGVRASLKLHFSSSEHSARYIHLREMEQIGHSACISPCVNDTSGKISQEVSYLTIMIPMWRRCTPSICPSSAPPLEGAAGQNMPGRGVRIGKINKEKRKNTRWLCMFASVFVCPNIHDVHIHPLIELLLKNEGEQQSKLRCWKRYTAASP